MITQEQINNLKPGDPVFVRGEFQSVDADGAIWIKICNCHRWYSPSCVSLPSETPKHDPTRLFKEGDRAQVVERNGRPLTCFPVGRIKEGDIVTVAENEAGDVFIKVLTEDGHEMMVPWFMLELVTPVEEIERYTVHHSTAGIWQVIDTKDNGIISNYVGHRHPNAKAAAEAERDRLNAEWRKEQK